MNDLPFVTAVCPTFRHPELLANSVALWQAQDYPLDRRVLLILDDDPTFDPQVALGWELYAIPGRLPTISAKYNTLLGQMPSYTDVVAVWEDDDFYLPGYISSHVKALRGAEFSKAATVLSDYTGQLVIENAEGRFHSSRAFRAGLIKRVGGWPDTRRADFDQQLMNSLAVAAGGRVARPWADTERPEFVYHWHTGAAHCQSTMRSPDDETWYDRAEQSYQKVPFVGKLVPKLSEKTIGIFKELEIPCEF